MTALTTFDREPDRGPRHDPVASVPWGERRWLRFAGLTLIVCWGLVCVGAVTLLTR